MAVPIEIGSKRIGDNEPVYVIAELSANHGQDFDKAVKLLHEAKKAGADAVKLQTYLPETMTVVSAENPVVISGGTPWDGMQLDELYREAYMPWDWQPKLKQIADQIGIELFSTAFDQTAVDFLEKVGVAVHKVASFELVDIPLIEKIARTRKPIIMSTGMASLGDVETAVQAARTAGAEQIVLLKCTSAYPAPLEEMNLKAIPGLAEVFQVPVGLSDHSLGIEAVIAAVALGARVVEKHVTLSRDVPGPDSSFSLEPSEFEEMVKAIRNAEKAIGRVCFTCSAKESASMVFRRSLYVTKDIAAGEKITTQNIGSYRPAYGIAPKYLNDVLGRRAKTGIPKGTPLSWDLVE